jgi:radical SAM protein with 4Fe4S-binding SPASM domain
MKKTPYPKTVTIETTLRCNLRCVHCVSRHRRAEYNADMSPELLEKVWPIVERAKDVSLDNQGEFFCNKDYLAIFRRARDMGKRTTITTNASRIDDDIIENVIFGGVTNLNFSVDGVNAATHEEFRRGSNYAALMASLRKICDRKKKEDRELPYVGINFVARRGNIEQLPAMVDLAHELGAQRLYVYHLCFFEKGLEKESLFYFQELSDRCFREARERNRGKSLELWLPGLFSEDAKHGRRRFRKCDFTLSSVIIGARGEVFACCDSRFTMGNLNEESFEEIWNGKRYNLLRKTVNSRSPQTICANCGYPYISNVSNPAAFFDWEMPR